MDEKLPHQPKESEIEQDIKQRLRLSKIEDALSAFNRMPTPAEIKQFLPMAEEYINEKNKIVDEREWTINPDDPSSPEELIKRMAADFIMKEHNKLEKMLAQTKVNEEFHTRVIQEKERIKKEGITEEEIDLLARTIVKNSPRST